MKTNKQKKNQRNLEIQNIVGIKLVYKKSKILEGKVIQLKKNSHILSRVKQITSPGWMHETSARAWYTGKTRRDRVREVGGGIGMGNTCKSMADSCQCIAKTTTIL